MEQASCRNILHLRVAEVLSLALVDVVAAWAGTKFALKGLDLVLRAHRLAWALDELKKETESRREFDYLAIKRTGGVIERLSTAFALTLEGGSYEPAPGTLSLVFSV